MFSSSSSKKKNQKGQGLVEYALTLVLVAIVVIAVVLILGPMIGNVFSKTNNSLSGTGGSANAGSAIITPRPVTAPTFTYQQWCVSLGPPNHINPQGTCVPGH